MELRVLKYFLVVATERNISNAAKILFVSQPALSKQLKDLEEELGVILFKRGNRNITLTENGVYFLAKTKEILSLVDITVTNLKQESIVGGEINIGAGESIQLENLFKIIRNIMREYPNIKTNIKSGNADDIILKLDNGLLDFAIILGFIDKSKYEHLSLPWRDKWGLLVRKDNSLSEKDYILAEDLKNIPLIISEQTNVGTFLAEWLGENIDNFNIVGTYNLLFNASLMAKQNIGSVLCLDGIINTNESDLKFMPLKPELKTDLSIIWKKNQTLSNVSKKFLENLKTSIS
ncbi:LysR family transcriptional regulator [Fusobacterium sp.]|uniref:LysR family transcriptional regulator n=1 Tax=Fusobacterium sp. TaxID=68766 RepID=UPI0025C53D51|nr:LysR family transcriptional regulator [Fusobacterium sp.]MCI5725465.1 LysR family transcriptional regulator [Fusobacterium sp.]MCI7223528.1 LysR family transcriptional regulator [Fusobacterium sp.]